MKRTTVSCAALVTAALFLFSAAGTFAQTREDEAVKSGLKKITELLQLIEKNYVGEVDESEMLDNSIRGMLGQLDPHSSYLSPSQTQQMASEQQGEYSGIGVTIGLRENRLTVVSPMEDGPAARQGIRTGDVITHIDGKPTSGEDYNNNVRQLRGPIGSEVTLTIRRNGMPEPIDVTIVRDRIALKTVPYAFMLNGDTGFIRLTAFAQTSDREVAEAVEQLKRKGMKNLILDLRSNPGGDLTASVGVANNFIDDGLIVYTKGLTESSREEYHATEESTRFRGPMVVLLNHGSASGSEVVAGALQDHDRAWLVGERSWGKGLVQTQYPLAYGGSLSLTTAKYYTPSGRLIQRPYTPGSFDEYYDPQEQLSQNRLAPATTVHLHRTVYGGNGIAPDSVIKSGDLTELSQQIMLRGLIFNFVTDYLSSQANVDETFRTDEGTMEAFRAFLENERIEIDEKQWRTDAEFLKSRVTLDVVNRVAGGEAAYRAVLGDDKQLEEALRHISDAAKLLERDLRDSGE